MRRQLADLGFRLLSDPAPGLTGDTVARGMRFAIKQSNEAPHRDECAFCPGLRFRLNRLENLPGATGVLWGDGDFFVVPDLAPLDEGHLLIVTVDHNLAMGACSEDVLTRLGTNLDRVSALFRSVYDREALFFEHGPASSGEAGACIDHAHMHCLPATASVVGTLRDEGLTVGPASLAGLKAQHIAGDSYLFVQEAGNPMCSLVRNTSNQLMRRLYSSALGKSTWRWQDMYMQPDSRQRFLETFNRLLHAVDQTLAAS
ncbi:hypothetical protein AB0B89_14270 [Sphaerisporangium sp. NPDC049002]|uniref:HIT family protein n=1 Tax=Sphaerisporangium sp. NPDC049002 TaxID=3155392 RepID=UPI0033F3AFC7